MGSYCQSGVNTFMFIEGSGSNINGWGTVFKGSLSYFLKTLIFERIQSNWIEILNIASNFIYKAILYLFEQLATLGQFVFAILGSGDILPFIACMS